MLRRCGRLLGSGTYKSGSAPPGSTGATQYYMDQLKEKEATLKARMFYADGSQMSPNTIFSGDNKAPLTEEGYRFFEDQMDGRLRKAAEATPAPTAQKTTAGAPAAATAAAAASDETKYTPGSVPTKGYKFFEDQNPKPKAPPSYKYFEDQMLSGTAKCAEYKPPKSESQALNEKHNWTKDNDGIPDIPPNYGWREEWGPEPGEDAHNKWYDKGREFMTIEEKMKWDLSISTPLKPKQFRHQSLPMHKAVASGYDELTKTRPDAYYDTKKKQYNDPFSHQEKNDYVMTARQNFVDEWLAKPGVTPQNVAMKMAEYNGNAKGKNVKPIPRRPEWEMAPLPEYDDD